jgi:hypothetical protein
MDVVCLGGHKGGGGAESGLDQVGLEGGNGCGGFDLSIVSC